MVCRGAKYPLWIAGAPTHITVTVLETAPAYRGGTGLLLTDRTVVELSPVGAMSSSPTSARKEGASRQGSSTTSVSSGIGGTDSVEDISSDSSKQQPAGLVQYFSSFLPFGKDKRSLPQDPLAPDEPQSAMSKERHPSKTLSGETVVLPVGRGREKGNWFSGHRKQPSLPAKLDNEPEVVERLTSEYINTPRMTVSLRVQPGAQLSRPRCVQCAEGQVPGMLDAMVHPATLPEVFHAALLVRGQKGSSTRVNFLVKIRLLPFVEPFSHPEEATSTGSEPESQTPPAQTPLSVDSMVDKSLAAASTAPPTTVPPALVVRLVFQGSLHPHTQHPSEAPSPLDGPALTESSVDSDSSSDRELDGSPTSALPKPFNRRHSVTMETSCATIVPGHVVLSDMVRRQLGVGLYGRVQLTELYERHKQTCLQITLQPLKEYKVGRPGLTVCGGRLY